MHTKQTQPVRPALTYPHFQLVYDLPAPAQTIENCYDAAVYFRRIWPETLDTEVTLGILMLNAYNQVIAHHLVSLGNPDYEITALAHCRMISWMAAQSCSSSVYICFNVPNELYCQYSDIFRPHVLEGLNRLFEAMYIIDIKLSDCILISPLAMISTRQELGNDWHELPNLNPAKHAKRNQ